MSDLVRLTAAASAAAFAHALDRRKGPPGAEPTTLVHLCEVAALAAEAGADAETIMAAYLHDAVEDGFLADADVRGRFGARVADLVEAVTDAPAWKALPTPARKALQAEHVAHAEAGAKIIKLCDQISNLRARARTPGLWPPESHRGFIEGALRVAAACAGVSPKLEAEHARAVAGLSAQL